MRIFVVMDNVLEIDIFGAIDVADFWGDGSIVTASMVREQLKANPDADKIVVNINSPGGVVTEGFAIYDMLAGAGKPVEVVITGLCASIATVISQAGDTIKMTANSEFMIHNPKGGIDGDPDDIQRYADEMRKVESKIIDFYHERTGKPKEELDALMKRETWMSAKEALEAGFITEILAESKLATQMINMVKLTERNTGKKLRAVAIYKPKTMSKPKTGFFQNLLNSIKNEADPVTNATYTLSDGTVILTDADGEIATGQMVTFEDGTVPPAGEHVLSDGRVITTDESGTITEVRDAEEAAAEQVIEALVKNIEKLSSTIESLQNENAEIKSAIAELGNGQTVQARGNRILNRERQPGTKVNALPSLKSAREAYKESQNSKK